MSSAVARLVLAWSCCAHAARIANHLRAAVADHAHSVREDTLHGTDNASLVGSVVMAGTDAQNSSIGVHMGQSGTQTKRAFARNAPCPPDLGSQDIRLNANHESTGDIGRIFTRRRRSSSGPRRRRSWALGSRRRRTTTTTTRTTTTRTTTTSSITWEGELPKDLTTQELQSIGLGGAADTTISAEDTDRDGRLHRMEYWKFLRKLSTTHGLKIFLRRACTSGDAFQNFYFGILKHWDLDFSGTISTQELLRVLRVLNPKPYVAQRLMSQVMAQADTNRDGALDVGELNGWLSCIDPAREVPRCQQLGTCGDTSS